ncbi:hypothetical protein AAFF27_15555 [Xylophilus sp. GW821-FHT01B05]
MTTTTSAFRTLAAVLAISAAAYGITAHAQPAAAPAASSAAEAPAPKTGVVEGAKEMGHKAATATKRGAKKVGHATSNAAKRSATAVRHTGERIGSKLPPAPRDEGLNSQGQPRTPTN